MDVSYPVHMDYAGFNELFEAQHGRYQRKMALIGAVPLTLLLLFMSRMLFIPPIDLEFVLAFVCLAAIDVLMIVLVIRPTTFLSTRSGLVRTWFAIHGSPADTHITMAQQLWDSSVKDLACDYQITLGDRGFTESSAAGVQNVPWFVLSGRRVSRPRGVYFCLDDGKESSALYNFIGINWVFRDENVNGLLFIPRDVVDANPGIVDEVRGLISESRSRYLGERGRQRLKSDDGFVAWMGETNLIPQVAPLEAPATSTQLADLRFTSQDLFVLCGGQDSCLVACNDAWIDLEKVRAENPVPEWRENLIRRLAPSGWVDQQGNPNAMLARVLEPLKTNAFCVSEELKREKRRFGVAFAGRSATAVVAAPDAPVGTAWQLLPFPDDTSLWPETFRGLFTRTFSDRIDYGVKPADRDYRCDFVLRPEDEKAFVSAALRGNRRELVEYAHRYGIDEDVLLTLGKCCKHHRIGFSMMVYDWRAATIPSDDGWRCYMEARGNVRVAAVVFFDSEGITYTNCTCWHEGIPDDFFKNLHDWKQQVQFISIGLHASGDLYQIFTQPIPEYPTAIPVA